MSPSVSNLSIGDNRVVRCNPSSPPPLTKHHQVNSPAQLIARKGRTDSELSWGERSLSSIEKVPQTPPSASSPRSWSEYDFDGSAPSLPCASPQPRRTRQHRRQTHVFLGDNSLHSFDDSTSSLGASLGPSTKKGGWK
uniref:Uncharacterized protein n=1 Tax=Grammatophora oceanica TaxID=210454 RepID=A0A7S1VND3_9STRA|mmetsp:Transcript_51446/g.76803  ORF Transcript_51446/g.76803 Transcript_51446/m.76803 type:complete len:138 (+) Transcript_51446:278-691(+)